MENRMKKTTKTTKKTTTKAKPAKKAKVVSPLKLFTGKIPATKLYKRTMTEFKNCLAEVYMAIDETEGKVCYINSYQGSPRSSFDPAKYTYKIVQKVIDKKIETMEEIDVTDWPEFVISAHATKTKTRKAK